ncbi:hypothetical protein [Tropicimonas marinistellae]|uniref:hypothetical protein n=1 Tax=Tropicimonas marinistellae TaxID=1739787 RepID=UPI0008353633|nr:hypothetical protein [Tropicimonas marinistellae]
MNDISQIVDKLLCAAAHAAELGLDNAARQISVAAGVALAEAQELALDEVAASNAQETGQATGKDASNVIQFPSAASQQRSLPPVNQQR